MNERKVTVPGGTFHYLSGGEPRAPLVLCLHGFPDHPRTFVPLMIWLMSAGFRVAAPWMRGYRPSVGHGPFSIERLALDVVEISRALSPSEPVHLVGHDWGGGGGI